MRACPTCGDTELEAVSDGESVNFYCQSCLSCWHLELGYVRRVEVTTCLGCEHRTACLLRGDLEHSVGAALAEMLR